MPVVQTAVVISFRRTDLGECTAGRIDELAQLHGVFLARLSLHAGRDVNTPWTHLSDAVGDVAGVQASGEKNAMTGPGGVFGETPIEYFTATRLLAFNQDDVGAVLRDPGQPRMASREPLYDDWDAAADINGLLGGLVSVQLCGAEAGSLDDLDHAVREFVAEHTNRQHLGRKSARNVAGSIDRDLPA